MQEIEEVVNRHRPSVRGKNRKLSRCSGEKKLAATLQGNYDENRVPKFMKKNFNEDQQTNKCIGRLP